MDWLNSIDQQKGIIKISVKGKKNVADSIKIVKESTRIAGTHQIHKYIFDLSKAVDKYSIVDIYEKLNNVEEYGFHKNDKVALVSTQYESEQEFAENVSYNYGWLKFKYFDSLMDAEKWLLNN